MDNATVQELLDREAIKEVRALLAQALDYRDWSLFESLFTEEVEVDFTPYGIPPQRVRREELRQSYQHNLSREGLRTQHISSNFRITVKGNTAQCISNFIGQHYIQGCEGGEEFFLRAEYTDQLVRTEQGWKIRALILSKLFYVSGNPAILANQQCMATEVNMQVRRFSPDLKTKIPGSHKGLYGVPIQFDAGMFATPEQQEALEQRMNGLPIMLNRPMHVNAMYFEPRGHMEEHNADVPILFVVIRGKGFVRIGGPDGETQEVTAGDAVLQPVGLDLMVWTGGESLDAIVIDGPSERTGS